jgi:hypothetical protein
VREVHSPPEVLTRESGHRRSLTILRSLRCIPKG